MWSVFVFLGTVGALWVAKRRSRQCWPDYLLLLTNRVYASFWHRLEPGPKVPWPSEGPMLLISNHTCSADPTFIVARCQRVPAFLVSREHFSVHPWIEVLLKYMRCIPVVRSGPDPGALRKGLRLLQERHMLVLFPEAGLSGVALNRLRTPRPGMALLALESGAPVYPIFIAGGPRTHRLVQSWLFYSGRRTRLITGPAVDLSRWKGKPRNRALIEEVRAHLMKAIADLDPSQAN